ncbi:MAG TPA: HAMP domain-containing protein, partial [Alphaproteobacteria bacterium]|nr:HAMP domain-containing protein [Alphaproteobacteria bacterium]
MLEALSSAALLPLILATLCAAAGGLVAARRAERLRARVTAFIFLACLPVPLLFAAAMYRTTLVEAEYAKSDALRMAKLIGGQQAAVLDSVRGLLEVVGRSVRIRGELATCEAYLEEIRQHNPIITAINRVEPDGRIACSSRHASSGADVSDLGYIRQAAESGALTLSGYRMGIVTGRPLIGMALPVRGGDGRTDFLVVAGIGLDGLGVSLAETDLPAGTETVLVDAEGRLLAARPATAGPLGGTVPWAAQARRDIAGAGVSAIGPERRLVAAAPFGPGGSGASVMVALPPDFADRTLNRLLRDAGLAVAAGMAVMLLAAWFVSQHLVVRWIGAMAAAAGAVGRGDLGRRVGPPYERGELGELARAFDGMAGALQRRERAAVAAAAELRASAAAAQRCPRVGSR